MSSTFVKHDQELFRIMRDLGRFDQGDLRRGKSELSWEHWQPISFSHEISGRRWTQVLDFETAHCLFMCMFCFLLTREDYRAAINGFNFDQSIALRIEKITGETQLPEMAYNKYPMYLVGPWNLTQRFLMHGFFTEHLYAYLEELRSGKS